MQFGSSVDRWLFRVTRAECSFFLKKKIIHVFFVCFVSCFLLMHANYASTVVNVAAPGGRRRG